MENKKRVKVDVYFTAIGMVDIPTEAETAALTEEIRNNPDKMKLIAKKKRCSQMTAPITY